LRRIFPAACASTPAILADVVACRVPLGGPGRFVLRSFNTKGVSMQSDRYRWQDHVPARVNWKMYLAFAAVFAVFLVWAGVERAVTAQSLHQEALTSIVETRLADSEGLMRGERVFVRHDRAPPGAAHDSLFCALKRVVL
jgi:hypothetical protein